MCTYVHTTIHTYTYIHIYTRIYGLGNPTSPGTAGRLWQRFASRCPESWATTTLTKVFSFLLWEPSLVRGFPQQGLERGDGAGGNIGIILCREGVFLLFCQQWCFSSV